MMATLPDLTEVERQVLIAISTAMSRGESRDRESLEKLGSSYFARFRVEWDDAYQSSLRRGMIVASDACFSLPAPVTEIAEKLCVENPQSSFFYEDYYERVRASRAHSIFCERVYGKDFAQHGLADLAQLDLLIATLRPR